MKKQSTKKEKIGNIKVFQRDLDLFNILCIENHNSTQPELFNKILEEYRLNGNK